MARINLDPLSQGKEESETIRKLTKASHHWFGLDKGSSKTKDVLQDPL